MPKNLSSRLHRHGLAGLLAGVAILPTSPVAAQPAPDMPAPPSAAAQAGVTPPTMEESGRQGPRHGHGGPQTLAEFQARTRERAMRADTDGDGRISLSEWAAAHPPRDRGEAEGGGRGYGDPARQFQMMDADHDGFVTPAEIDAASAARFTRMDANHDGVLTPEERSAMWRGRSDRSGSEGGPQ